MRGRPFTEGHWNGPRQNSKRWNPEGWFKEEEEESSLCVQANNGSHDRGAKKGKEFTKLIVLGVGDKAEGGVALPLTLAGAWKGPVGHLGRIMHRQT